jgi:anti-sigma factor RsiW
MNSGNDGDQLASDLAAYFDGELPTERALHVEAWLEDRPELAAELNAQTEITRLFQSVPPLEPSLNDWNQALAQIEIRLAPRPHPVPVASNPSAHRVHRYGFGWTAAAAASIVLALWVAQPPRPADMDAQRAFPVAEAEDVEIQSIHGQDMGQLVVGAVPLEEPVALAAAHDVTVESMQPDADGMVPEIGAVSGDAHSPMLYTPLPGLPPSEKTQ